VTPGFREYWNRRKSAFVPEFQQVMETWLLEPTTALRPDVLVGHSGKEAQVT
jgi:hypothetical protein